MTHVIYIWTWNLVPWLKYIDNGGRGRQLYHCTDAVYINILHAIGLFLYPLKTYENHLFSNVSRGSIRRLMAWNELTGIIRDLKITLVLVLDSIVIYYRSMIIHIWFQETRFQNLKKKQRFYVKLCWSQGFKIANTALKKNFMTPFYW